MSYQRFSSSKFAKSDLIASLITPLLNLTRQVLITVSGNNQASPVAMQKKIRHACNYFCNSLVRFNDSVRSRKLSTMATLTSWQRGGTVAASHKLVIRTLAMTTRIIVSEDSCQWTECRPLHSQSSALWILLVDCQVESKSNHYNLNCKFLVQRTFEAASEPICKL